jgi:hypothetical protein
MARNQGTSSRRRTEPDPHTLSSTEAARILGYDVNRFNSWWDPTRRGWHIPIGVDTVFVTSIGDSPNKRRAPKAVIVEIALYGRVPA